MPTISILIPVRDGAPYLVEALESVACQTFSDFEAVVVNDGSTDGTGELLESWSAADPRFTLLHQEPEGIVAALERARAAAKAPFIARFDADDVMHPRRLEEQLALLTSDE